MKLYRQTFYSVGQIFIVVDGQILKIIIEPSGHTSCNNSHLIFDVTNDESHVEIIRSPLVRIEGVSQLVLRLPRQNVVAVELAAVGVYVEWLHSKNPEVVRFLVRQNVIVELKICSVS